MRAAAFFATVRRSRQQLFQPYVPPLSERSKKRLRKEALLNEPTFHAHKTRDAEFILRAFTPHEPQKRAREAAFERVRDIVKKHAGEEFELLDIGMRNYAADIADAPLEYAIVDTSRPAGIPPGTDPAQLPKAYDPTWLASLFLKEGFTGYFPHYPRPGFHDTLQVRLLHPAERFCAWPEYTTTTDTRPAVLAATMPFEFTLRLPDPAVLARYKFLSAYGTVHKGFEEYVGLAYLWFRCLGFIEFTPTSVALLAVAARQHYKWASRPAGERETRPYKCPSEASAPPPPGQSERGAWIGGEWRSFDIRTLSIPISTPIVTSLFHFLRFLMDSRTWWYEHIVSLRAVHSHRIQPFNHSAYTRYLTSRNMGWDSKYDVCEEDGSLQPKVWQLDTLVMQDPFDPEMNHTARTSSDMMQILSHNAAVAQRILGSGHQLMSIFGPHAAPLDEPTRWRERDVPESYQYDVTDVHVGPQAPPHQSHGSQFGDSTEHAGAERERRFGDTRMSGRRFGDPIGARGLHSIAQRPIIRIKGPPPTIPPKDRTWSQSVRKKGPHPGDVAKYKRKVERGLTVPGQRLDQDAIAHAMRTSLIARVQNVIYMRFGKGLRCVPFGSTEYGACSPKSDVDLVVLDESRPLGWPPHYSKLLHRVYSLSSVAHHLRGLGGFMNVKVIPASVPIVNFLDPKTQLQVDLNINDRLGLYNTQLLARYCDLFPLLRLLALAIKKWAAPLGLNKPSIVGSPPTFSSYAFMLMSIGFLQARGLLPNLQADMPKLKAAATEGVFWTQSGIRRDVRFSLRKDWTPREDMGLEEVLLDWFKFWGDEFDYEHDLISIRHGGIIRHQDLEHLAMPVAVAIEAAEADVDAPEADLPNKESRKKGGMMKALLRGGEVYNQTWASHIICVVDPFIREKNVTQNLAYAAVSRFKAECKRILLMTSMGMPLSKLIKDLPQETPSKGAYTPLRNRASKSVASAGETKQRVLPRQPSASSQEAQSQETALAETGPSTQLTSCRVKKKQLGG